MEVNRGALIAALGLVVAVNVWIVATLLGSVGVPVAAPAAGDVAAQAPAARAIPPAAASFLPAPAAAPPVQPPAPSPIASLSVVATPVAATAADVPSTAVAPTAPRLATATPGQPVSSATPVPPSPTPAAPTATTPPQPMAAPATPTARSAATERVPDPGSLAISAADVGDAWPLDVPAGLVRCERLGGGAGAVWFEAAGKRYAVNGFAKSSKQGRDIDEIWSPDPTTPGAKKNIGPIIERGLRLC